MALDLVNGFVVDHHRLVTGLSVQIAAHMGVNDEDIAPRHGTRYFLGSAMVKKRRDSAASTS